MPRQTTPGAPDPHGIRGLVFDLDGTLVDSYHAIASSLNHARAGFGLEQLDADRIRRGVGRGLEVLIAEFVCPDRVDEGVRLFREQYARVYSRETRALPGVQRALFRLRSAGYVMSVASNKPARFSEPILSELGLLELFRAVEGPDRCGATKPDPRMIRSCLTSMDTPAGQALYVGDMVLDAESGARSDVGVVLIEGGSSDAASLRATGCPVLASIDELPDWIAARPGC